MIITYDPSTFNRSFVSTSLPRRDFRGWIPIPYTTSTDGQWVERGVLQIYPLPFESNQQHGQGQPSHTALPT